MSRMTDFCDVVCDGEDCGNWLATGERTLAASRKWIRRCSKSRFSEAEGWRTIKNKDYCPKCVEKKESHQ